MVALEGLLSRGSDCKGRRPLRVGEQTIEHENYESKLKDISQDQFASHRLQGAISFLMPDEKHLGVFSHMGFHVISCVQMNDCYGECLCD